MGALLTDPHCSPFISHYILLLRYYNYNNPDKIINLPNIIQILLFDEPEVKSKSLYNFLRKLY